MKKRNNILLEIIHRGTGRPAHSRIGARNRTDRPYSDFVGRVNYFHTQSIGSRNELPKRMLQFYCGSADYLPPRKQKVWGMAVSARLHAWLESAVPPLRAASKN